jgi:Tol biopolymer transport system component
MLMKWVLFILLSLLSASLGVVYAQTGIVEQLDWNSDGSRLLLAYSTERIQVVDSSNNQILFQRNLTRTFKTAEWHPTNPSLFAVAENDLATRSGTVSIIDIGTGQIANSIVVTEAISDIAWSPNGQAIAIAVGSPSNQAFSRHIRIWNVATNRIDLIIPYNQVEIAAIAWSPDGRRLVSSGFDSRMIFWDALTGQQIDAIPTPAIMQNLAWSPDGTKIASSTFTFTTGFWIWDAQTRRNLLTIQNASAFDLEWNSDSVRLATTDYSNRVKLWDGLRGRELSSIVNSSPVYDMAWNPNGTILALATNSSFPTLIRFPVANAGIDQNISDINNDGAEIVSLNGSASSDPDGVIFNYQWIENGNQIATGLNGQANLRVGSHTIVLMTTDNQGAVDFDEVIVNVVAGTTNNPSTPISPSPNIPGSSGRIVYSANGNLYLTDPQFNSPQLLHQGIDPAFSPDGSKIVFAARQEGDYEIFVMNLDGSNVMRLTQSRARDRYPAWSPDGTKIVFASVIFPDDWEIYTINADGTGGKAQITNNNIDDFQPSWSPDGRRIAFSRYDDEEENFDIHSLNLGSRSGRQLTTRASNDLHPSWSPDGTKLVFTSAGEIFVINANGGNLVRLTNTGEPDKQANFSPDGSQIIFSSTGRRNSDLYLMNADGSNLRRLSSTTEDEVSPAWGYP